MQLAAGYGIGTYCIAVAAGHAGIGFTYTYFVGNLPEYRINSGK